MVHGDSLIFVLFLAANIPLMQGVGAHNDSKERLTQTLRATDMLKLLLKSQCHSLRRC